ncbi:MAG: hypothetical protein KJ792_11075, partial [Actinobacteria bacterium]|nr:hypothetical protein [Actinomycetota bacterium]
MTSGDYLPGSHLAVVEAHGAALLPASTPGEVLAAVRAALGPDEPDGERAAVLLETLTLGTRLSVLPPFAVAVLAPGRVDLLVRGPYRVAVTGARPVQVDGLHVTSWREESAEAPTLVELTGDVEPADGGDRPGLSLTLDRGVAFAGSVRIAPEPSMLDAVRTGQGAGAVVAAVQPDDVRRGEQRRPRSQAGSPAEV